MISSTVQKTFFYEDIKPPSKYHLKTKIAKNVARLFTRFITRRNYVPNIRDTRDKIIRNVFTTFEVFLIRFSWQQAFLISTVRSFLDHYLSTV